MVLQAIRDFIQQSMRVLRVSYHPTPEEFNMTAKITGLGMVAIGMIGYLITLIFRVIAKV
jgi:protein transport protein SEC61 subunit gamma-like protein